MEFETDNITKNIVKEIIRECTSYVQIDEYFVVYYVKLLLLDPSWKISSVCALNRNRVFAFVQNCIENLINKPSAAIITLKMQYLCLKSMIDRKGSINGSRQKLNECLEPLLVDICNYNQDERYCSQKLMRKIIYYITILSGLGDPSNSQVYREALLALSSILDENELEHFTKLTRTDKHNKLHHYMTVVAGIRLFNHNSFGSVGIVNLPQILTSELQIAKEELNKELNNVSKQINVLTAFMRSNFKIEPMLNGNFVLKEHCREGITQGVLKQAKDLLTLTKQHEIYIRNLISEITHTTEKSNETVDKFQKTLKRLNKITQYNIAVPVNHILPLIKELAGFWRNLQEYVILLSNYDQIRKILRKITISFYMQKNLKFIFNNEYLWNATTEPVESLRVNLSNCVNINYKPDMDKGCLQYLGFCAWYLVETNGCLIPGNTKLGIYQWDKQLFAFSCREALIMFDLNPKRYIAKSIDIARKHPELINLLKLHDDLHIFKDVEQLYVQPPDVIRTSDATMQTELHTSPRGFDPTYKWNVWDLYRQAIQLANISKCLTHSSQTSKTFYRVSSHSQFYALKDASSQAKTENNSNTATLSNFMFGLRGRKDNNQHIIQLTRPPMYDWIEFHSKNDQVPHNAVLVGHDLDSSPMYVGRVMHNQEMTLAKVIPRKNMITVSYNGVEIEKSYCHILINYFYKNQPVWVEGNDGHVPPNAVQCGFNKNGFKLFVSRVKHLDWLIPGKVHTGYKVYYYGYGGQEHHSSYYEVLINE